ncbi:MAG TPA: hypothetical protein VIB38_09185, partial [Aestuariivirgaceae bacterium]
MSFEVIASSRVEKRQITPWRFVVQTGVQIGLLGIFLTVVGIFGMFNKRPVIVGYLTLGYAALGVIFLTAGLLAAWRRVFATNVHTLLGGAVAGAIAGAILALVPTVMSFMNLRTVFVSLDNLVFKMLTFGLYAPLGIAALIALGAALGLLGALLMELPERLGRPIAAGLTAAGLAGLFQELIRPILANSRTTKPIHDLLYTWTGLTLRGAIIIFALVAAGTLLWILSRERVRSQLSQVPAPQRHRIRWGFIAAALVLCMLFPLYAGNFIGQVLLTVGLFTLMGMGLNLEVGIAGL